MFIFISLLVQGLQCYTCGSSTSMDDCSSQQIKTTCPRQLPSTYCGKVQVKDTSGAVPKIFIKGSFLTPALNIKHNCVQCINSSVN